MQNNYFIRPFIVTICVLLLPFVAMFFDENGATWGIEDFVAAFILLFGTGTAYEVLSKKVQKKGRRIILALILTGILLFIWAQLAVGIF